METEKIEYLKSLGRNQVFVKNIHNKKWHGEEFDDDVAFLSQKEGRFIDITFHEIANSREFFIEASKSWKETRNGITGVYAMSDELKKDINFAIQLVDLCFWNFTYFERKVKRNKEVIKTYIKGFNQHLEETNDIPFSCATDDLLTEDRITVAYEICKEYPEYANCFGKKLTKMLNGMDINEFMEKKNLMKLLKKDLSKKEKSSVVKI